MKTSILILLLTLSFPYLRAHQAVSVKAGDFFSDSVWAGGIQPNLSSDSIYVENNLNYYQGISLSGTCFLHINKCIWICGNQYISLRESSFIYNQGSIFTDSILDYGTILNNGYIDIAGQGMTVDSGGSFYADSSGYLYGHMGMQTCQPPIIAIDSNNWNINQNTNTLFIAFILPQSTFMVDFGDGDTTITDSFSVSHTYSTYGIFFVTIRVFYMCDTFTQSETFEFDSLCTAPTTFIAYPNPCSDYFYIQYSSCLPGAYTLPIYNLLGQKVKSVGIDNTGNPVLVEMDDVVNGIYIIKGPDTMGRSGSRKIVVVH